MSESCTHECSSCQSECKDRKQMAGMLEETNPMSEIDKVIGIVSGKGGVGKSLMTSLMASEMQKRGKQTAILDADITGPSIPKTFGIHEKAKGVEEGLLPLKSKNGTKVMSVNLILENETDPVVWRSPIITGVVKQFWSDVIWSEVDYMFVDMPPGTGDVPLTVMQSLPLNGIVIVTSPQELVSEIVEKAVKMAKMMHIPILGIVENMSYYVCPNCKEEHSIFGESHVEELAQKYGIPVVCKIPIMPSIASMCDKGKVEQIDAVWLEKLVNSLL